MLTASLGTKGLLLLNIIYVLFINIDYCYKKLSIVHDTNMVPINYLFLLLDIVFLPSLSHRFTFGHSGLTRMLYYISYYMETAPL